MNPAQIQNHFDAFYEDIWCEMCNYGEVEELVVCDNNNDRESTFLCRFYCRRVWSVGANVYV